MGDGDFVRAGGEGVLAVLVTIVAIDGDFAV